MDKSKIYKIIPIVYAIRDLIFCIVIGFAGIEYGGWIFSKKYVAVMIMILNVYFIISLI